MLKNEKFSRRYDRYYTGIPTTSTSQTLDVCTEGGRTRAVEVKLHNFSYIPLGGDQLTIARIWGRTSGRVCTCDRKLDRSMAHKDACALWR